MSVDGAIGCLARAGIHLRFSGEWICGGLVGVSEIHLYMDDAVGQTMCC